ncbi:hypothetical protein U1Q18_023515 [Sarracenia purpurea var. burkii]
MDSEGRQYVDRPWEHDPKHTMDDYLQGRAGKYVPGSSSAIEIDGKPTDKPQKKLKDQKPGSSSGPVTGAKLGGKPLQKRKK